MGIQPTKIFLSRGNGINKQVTTGFHVVKHQRTVEVEAEFGGIEHLKQHDFVTRRSQCSEISLKRSNRRKEVENQNHERSLTHDFNDALERRGEIGGCPAAAGFKLQHKPAGMADAVARGEEIPNR